MTDSRRSLFAFFFILCACVFLLQLRFSSVSKDSAVDCAASPILCQIHATSYNCTTTTTTNNNDNTAIRKSDESDYNDYDNEDDDTLTMEESVNLWSQRMTNTNTSIKFLRQYRFPAECMKPSSNIRKRTFVTYMDDNKLEHGLRGMIGSIVHSKPRSTCFTLMMPEDFHPTDSLVMNLEQLNVYLLRINADELIKVPTHVSEAFRKRGFGRWTKAYNKLLAWKLYQHGVERAMWLDIDTMMLQNVEYVMDMVDATAECGQIYKDRRKQFKLGAGHGTGAGACIAGYGEARYRETFNSGTMVFLPNKHDYDGLMDLFIEHHSNMTNKVLDDQKMLYKYFAEGTTNRLLRLTQDHHVYAGLIVSKKIPFPSKKSENTYRIVHFIYARKPYNPKTKQDQVLYRMHAAFARATKLASSK